MDIKRITNNMSIDNPDKFGISLSSESTKPSSKTNKDNFSVNSSEIKNLDHSTKQEIVKNISDSYNQIKNEYENNKNHQGILGKFWNSAKNTVGVSKEGKSWYNPLKWWGYICNSDTGSDHVEAELQKLENHVKELKKNPDKLPDLYEKITDKKLTNEELQKVKQGQNLLEKSGGFKAVKEFDESQKIAVDVMADLVSGVTSFGIFVVSTTIGIAAAPFTGGASLGLIAGGIALAGTSSAGIKAGLKYLDAKTGGRDYDTLGYDLVTGGINGLIAPVSAGVGGVAGKTLATRLGVSATRTGIELTGTQAAEQGFKGSVVRTLLTPGYNYTEGSLLARGAALTTEMATGGAMAGSFDNATRHVATTKSLDGVGEAFLIGAAGGFVMSPIIGGGFRGALRAVKPINHSVESFSKEIQKAHAQARMDFDNVRHFESIDLEIARNIASLVKRGKLFLDDSQITPLISDIKSNFGGIVADTNRGLKSMQDHFEQNLIQYRNILRELQQTQQAGADMKPVVEKLNRFLDESNNFLQQELTSFASHNQHLSGILSKIDEILPQKALKDELVDIIDDSVALSKTIGKEYKDTKTYKSLGIFAEEYNEMTLSITQQAKNLYEIRDQIKAAALKGNFDELKPLLQEYQTKLSNYVDSVIDSSIRSDQLKDSFGISDLRKTIMERLMHRKERGELDGLSPKDLAQRILEDSSIALNKFIQTMASDKNLPPNVRAFFSEFLSNCSVSRTLEQAQNLTNQLYGNGKYTILQSFGAGTIGETYLARTQNGKEVVIKILKEGINPERFKADKDFILKFIRESDPDNLSRDYKIKFFESLFNSWIKELDSAQEALGARNMISDMPKRYSIAAPLEVGVKDGRNISLVLEKAEGMRLDNLINLARFYKDNPSDYLTKSVKDIKGKEHNPWIKLTNEIEKNPWIKNPQKWMKELPETYIKAENEQFMFIPKSEYRTMHADPHEGNIFISASSETGKLKITYIDTGNTLQRNSTEILQDLGMSLNFMVGNSKAIANKLLQGAHIPEGVNRNMLAETLADELDKNLFKAGIHLKDIDYNQHVINDIMKKLNIIPDVNNSNFLKATIQKLKTGRALLQACGEKPNVSQDLRDLSTGILQSFYKHPKDTIKMLLPILNYIRHNRYDAMRVLFQINPNLKPLNA